MAKSFLAVISSLIVCLGCSTACLSAEEPSKEEMYRYRIYFSPGPSSIGVLLDTETGKVWQLSSDMAGKLKVEGVTVEGLAFSRTDNETMQRKVSEIDLNSIVEKDRPQCRDKLISVFSYGLDDDKINAVFKKYSRRAE